MFKGLIVTQKEKQARVEFMEEFHILLDNMPKGLHEYFFENFKLNARVDGNMFMGKTITAELVSNETNRVTNYSGKISIVIMLNIIRDLVVTYIGSKIGTKLAANGAIIEDCRVFTRGLTVTSRYYGVNRTENLKYTLNFFNDDTLEFILKKVEEQICG